MKKRTLLTCGLAAALFAGCSSDDKLTGDDGTVAQGKSGYLALNVSLPTTGNAPRAIGTDNQSDDKYNQGAPDEYAVNTIHLVCYDASGNALQAFKYTGDAWSTPTSPASGITTESVLKVQPVKAEVDQILVLVNAPATLTFETDAEGKMNGKMTYGGTTASTFTAFKAFKFTDDVTGGGSSFFMSNSPLSNGTALTELVQVDPKNTMEEAMVDVRTVNVERATGKVSLAHKANKQPSDAGYPEGWTDWTYQLGASGYVKDEVTFTGWMLDVTNNVTYPVRHYNKEWEKSALEGRNGQRFRGTTTYKGNGNADYNRTYWAEDPNYGSYVIADFTKATGLAFTSNDLAKALYCKENTFDVQNMEQRQSTRILLQAKYVPFKNDTWAPESDGTWYRLGNSNVPYNATEINTLIHQISGCNLVNLKSDITSTSAKAFTTNELTGLEADPTAQLTAINNALGTITVFSKGICFYVARIQHFGSYYTPWGTEDGGTATGFDQFVNYTKESASDNLDKAFLGRYGIVRNNWYELELGKVSSPGEPIIPEIPSDVNSDDELNYYIQANVKIMDWAVRKQSVDL